MSETNSTKPIKICQFGGCERPAKCLGLCEPHYLQKRRGSELSPIHSKKRPNNTPPRIEYDEVPCPRSDLEGLCHVFRGCKCEGGYGEVHFRGETWRVHVYVWERDGGPIPDKMQVDHQCKNRACCNVKHLRVVTQRINLIENSNGMAARNYAKTHCPKGHPYDSENTYIYKRTGGRRCRKCNAMRAREKAMLKSSY